MTYVFDVLPMLNVVQSSHVACNDRCVCFLGQYHASMQGLVDFAAISSGSEIEIAKVCISGCHYNKAAGEVFT